MAGIVNYCKFSVRIEESTDCSKFQLEANALNPKKKEGEEMAGTKKSCAGAKPGQVIVPVLFLHVRKVNSF